MSSMGLKILFCENWRLENNDVNKFGFGTCENEYNVNFHKVIDLNIKLLIKHTCGGDIALDFLSIAGTFGSLDFVLGSMNEFLGVGKLKDINFKINYQLVID